MADRALGARVCIVDPCLLPYRTPLFEALRADLGHRGIRLDLLYAVPEAARVPTEWPGAPSWAIPVPTRTFRLGGRDVVQQSLRAHLDGADLVVFTEAVGQLAMWAALRRQARGPRVAMWGHGGDLSRPRSRMLDRLVGVAVRRAHWWFGYTDAAQALLAGHGRRGGISIVGNAVDVREVREGALAADRADVLRRVGLGGGPVVAYLGHFGRAKRIGHLLAAVEHARRDLPSLQLLLLGGGGEDARAVEDFVGRTSWAAAPGPLTGRALGAHLAAAELVALPASVGLAVFDALAVGRPLLASTAFRHGPELQLVGDVEGVVLVDDGADPRRFAAELVRVLADPAGLEARQQAAWTAGAANDFDGYVRTFADEVEVAVSAPRAR
jgi:glycosyltransferase involved in cell wall biosynthesis